MGIFFYKNATHNGDWVSYQYLPMLLAAVTYYIPIVISCTLEVKYRVTHHKSGIYIYKFCEWPLIILMLMTYNNYSDS
jgi:hypothetical protein